MHSKADSSLLVYNHNVHQCYILIYVDDIVITGSSQTDIDGLVLKLHKKFSLKDLGFLSYFLGVEVSYPVSGGIFLSQSKYISDLLERTKMTQANGISTPMLSGSVMSAFKGEKIHDVRLYRSTVGAFAVCNDNSARNCL